MRRKTGARGKYRELRNCTLPLGGCNGPVVLPASTHKLGRFITIVELCLVRSEIVLADIAGKSVPGARLMQCEVLVFFF